MRHITIFITIFFFSLLSVQAILVFDDLSFHHTSGRTSLSFLVTSSEELPEKTVIPLFFENKLFDVIVISEPIPAQIPVIVTHKFTTERSSIIQQKSESTIFFFYLYPLHQEPVLFAVSSRQNRMQGAAIMNPEEIIIDEITLSYEGCPYRHGYFAIGTRILEQGIAYYCDVETQLILKQKKQSSACTASYECESNTCNDHLCLPKPKKEVTLSFLDPVYALIIQLFSYQ